LEEFERAPFLRREVVCDSDTCLMTIECALDSMILNLAQSTPCPSEEEIVQFAEGMETSDDRDVVWLARAGCPEANNEVRLPLDIQDGAIVSQGVAIRPVDIRLAEVVLPEQIEILQDNAKDVKDNVVWKVRNGTLMIRFKQSEASRERKTLIIRLSPSAVEGAARSPDKWYTWHVITDVF
jgi:hypothetical protein